MYKNFNQLVIRVFLLSLISVSWAYPMDQPIQKDKENINQELFGAVTSGNSDAVRRLLHKEDDVNVQNEADDKVPLVTWKGVNAVPSMPLLIHPGTVSIEGLDHSLSIAIEMKHKAVVRLLLQHGALLAKDDPRISMINGLFDGNELLRAVMVSDIDNVSRELARKVDISIIQEALLLAIGQGRVAVIVRLVSHFVDCGMREYLTKEARERLMMLYARCQSDVLAQRYRNIGKLLSVATPSVLDMGSISSIASQKFLAP